MCCYVLVIIMIWPLLMVTTSSFSSPDSSSSELLQKVEHEIHQHQFQADGNIHLPPAWKDAHVPGQEKIGAMASTLKKKINKMREGRGVTDAQLLHSAVEEFNLRKAKRDTIAGGRIHAAKHEIDAGGSANVEANGAAVAHGDDRRGFVVLGMHRSGTSMLSGLLATSCGYTVGGPLIGAHFDNEKGFFERIDVVLQNDEFMAKQRIWWSHNVINYNPDLALEHKKDGTVTFDKYGKPGLDFLNNPSNAPWLQKDPRMCITLKTWLKLMNNEPAVVYTYRHPLEVAMSLHKREKNFPMELGLRLWIVYNMRGIQNSKGLCIVKSSNDALLSDPLNEVQRISDELTSLCGVPAPPHRVSQEDVDKFVDPNLQHNKKQLEAKGNDGAVIAEYNDGKCKVREYKSDVEEGTVQHEREQKLYGIAMKIYCDFQSGKVYEDDYEWPDLRLSLNG